VAGETVQSPHALNANEDLLVALLADGGRGLKTVHSGSVTAYAGDFGFLDVGGVAGGSSDLGPPGVGGEVAPTARLIRCAAVVGDLVLAADGVSVKKMEALKPGELMTAAAGDSSVGAGGPCVPRRRHDMAVETELRVSFDVSVDLECEGDKNGGYDYGAGGDDAPCPGACER